MVTFYEVIGNNVRQWRQERGFSQEILAERCGLHRTYIGQVERGEINISAQNIAKIAKGLQIHPCQLLESGKKHYSIPE